MRRAVSCRECGAALHSSHELPTPGTVRHMGRSLCGTCRARHVRDGTLVDVPRITRTRDDMLDDWRLIGGPPLSHSEAARRLGVPTGTLTKALTRAGIYRNEPT